MPTTFAADWSKAKAAFTGATQAKKPSASFLGVFNKGTGISAALKNADAAKTVGELGSAMKAFKPAFEDYAKTLDKAIADPKVTDAAAKPAYVAAATKLKKELTDIYARAGEVSRMLAGAGKKEAANPADLKAQVEAKQYEALKPKIDEVRKINRSTMTNRQEFDKINAEFIDQIGNRIAEIRPKGEVGGKVEDFMKDPEVNKWSVEAKARFAAMDKNHQAYIANYNTAVKLRDSLPESHKVELDDVIKDQYTTPQTFSAAIDKELKKKPGRRVQDAVAAMAEQATATLNPRHLEVKAAELSKLNDLVFANCTAATKAQQAGGKDKAKTSLAAAHAALDKMEVIVTPINKDYQAQKLSVEKSKDGKDIVLKLAKIAGIHKKAIQTVESAQKQIV